MLTSALLLGPTGQKLYLFLDDLFYDCETHRITSKFAFVPKIQERLYNSHLLRPNNSGMFTTCTCRPFCRQP